MAEKEGKTEEPTSRRLEEAHKKGDIPRSKDLGAAVSLFATLIFMVLFMPFFSTTSLAVFKKYFSQAGQTNITESSSYILGKEIFNTYLSLVIPLFLLLVVVAVVMEVIQAGSIQLLAERIQIKWEKVFFIGEIPKGLKKIMMSVEALTELVKSIVKTLIIGLIAYYSLRGQVENLMTLPFRPLGDILDMMGTIFLKLSFNIILFLLALSVVDYLWQRFQYTKKLKMSKQDIKDEYKNAEGDPQIKARQKRIQYQWAMRRMMAEVPKADVVITNPTHFAVALKYESKKMHSPMLVAKGQDLIAENIKKIARENKVPVVENPPVARALFDAVEIGDFVPDHLFKPVAEVLAYIYKLKGKKVK